MVGKIHPPSSKGHTFLVIATDYFTKWVEAIPLKKVDQENIIHFIKEHIIFRFEIPESITTDQGTMFVGDKVQEFANNHGIKMINSNPYYPQADGQAEATNKVIIKILKKMLQNNPRSWHQMLSETL